jgi:hypothetical protein
MAELTVHESDGEQLGDESGFFLDLEPGAIGNGFCDGLRWDARARESAGLTAAEVRQTGIGASHVVEVRTAGLCIAPGAIICCPQAAAGHDRLGLVSARQRLWRHVCVPFTTEP